MTMTNPMLPSAVAADKSCGGRLVTTEGRELPLRGARLQAATSGGIARVILSQRFINPHTEPLRVSYQVPMPAFAAVAGYAFTIGDVKIVGQIDKKAKARERFEDALMDGRTAALLEQDRSSLFNQEVGNIPPGAEVVTELTIDQPLKWLGDGQWEWRFPTVVAPRYLGAEGRVADADRVVVDVADGPVAARMLLSLCITDSLAGSVSSPSHSVSHHHSLRADALGFDAASATEVAFGGEAGARLDRDIVVRWPVAALNAGATLETARSDADHPRAGSAYGLLTLVPPRPDAQGHAVARDLCVLIDTSGSMGGEPLAQAARVIEALIGTMTERDQLELIEFSWRPNRWKRRPVPADARNRKAAIKWVRGLEAGGATEMRDGIIAALDGLRADAQRQVLLITDGMIGFEEEIVAEIRDRMPRGSRVHTLGVGHGVNRSLTGPAARAGAGIELICAPGEDAEPLAARLLENAGHPLVVDVAISGPAVRSCGHQRLPDLFAGAPALLPVELDPAGGRLIVEGRTATGRWSQTLNVAAVGHGEGSWAIPTRFARERIEDLETARAAGRHASDIDPQIERLGLDFRIATRLTSWVAVSNDETVDPQAPTRRERMPHELGAGLSAEGIGLRSTGDMMQVLSAAMPSRAMAGAVRMRRGGVPSTFAAHSVSKKKGGMLGRVRDAAANLFGGGGDDDSEDYDTPTFLRRSQQYEESDDFEETTGSFGVSMFTDDAPVPASPPAPQGAPPPAMWEARLVRADDTALVLEIDVAADDHWDPGTEVMIQLEDGTMVSAVIRVDRTTRAGHVTAGQTVRLWLLPSAPLSEQPRLVVADDMTIMVVG